MDINDRLDALAAYLSAAIPEYEFTRTFDDYHDSRNIHKGVGCIMLLQGMDYKPPLHGQGASGRALVAITLQKKMGRNATGLDVEKAELAFKRAIHDALASPDLPHTVSGAYVTNYKGSNQQNKSFAECALIISMLDE